MDRIVIVSAFCFLSCFVFFLLSKCFLFLFKKEGKDDLEMEKILSEAIAVEREYLLLRYNGKLVDYPHLETYLKGSTYIIQGSYELINRVKLESYSKEPSFNDFSKELLQAPNDVRVLVYRQVNTMQRIFKLRYPIRAVFTEIKKRVALQILRFLVNVLQYLLKFLYDHRRSFNNGEHYINVLKKDEVKETIENTKCFS